MSPLWNLISQVFEYIRQLLDFFEVFVFVIRCQLFGIRYSLIESNFWIWSLASSFYAKLVLCKAVTCLPRRLELFVCRVHCSPFAGIPSETVFGNRGKVAGKWYKMTFLFSYFEHNGFTENQQPPFFYPHQQHPVLLLLKPKAWWPSMWIETSTTGGSTHCLDPIWKEKRLKTGRPTIWICSRSNGGVPPFSPCVSQHLGLPLGGGGLQDLRVDRLRPRKEAEIIKSASFSAFQHRAVGGAWGQYYKSRVKELNASDDRGVPLALCSVCPFCLPPCIHTRSFRCLLIRTQN